MRRIDLSNKTPNLAFMIICIICVSGLQPLDKLSVNILDGEVIIFWNYTTSSNIQYNVQMATYPGEWAMVLSCTRINKTYCDLTNLINDYHSAYKVRVQVADNNEASEWTYSKKLFPNRSDLQPPSFTVWATSSTLTVSIHEKPILKKLFPFGVTYTFYLEERSKNNKKTTAYLQDDLGKDVMMKTFSSLQWETIYCISIRVEGNGALSRSSVSPEECLMLPEREWFIIAVSSLSIVGGLIVIAIAAMMLLCYLKRPERMPTALKSPTCGWHPLTIGDGTIEVVTDKGWFLSSNRTEFKHCIPEDQMTLQVAATEDNDGEERRTSMDSGVDMVSSFATSDEKSPKMRQEDSGCGSMGGSGSSASSQTVYPPQDDRTDGDSVQKREDSGVEFNCQLGSPSVDGQDNGPLMETTAESGYRMQHHTSVPVCNAVEEMKQILPHTVLAEMKTGYRAAPQSCICSGAGQCTWCHNQGLHVPETINQHRAMHIENGLWSSTCNLMDKDQFTFSSYSRKIQTGTIMLSDFETNFIQLGESFPLLTALSPSKTDCNMNNVCL
ncbi:interleukin-10 receptor subunit alpha isoform 2-T2 [Aulostomus maculatus]